MTATTATIVTAADLKVGDVMPLNSGPFVVTEPVTVDAGAARIVGTNGDGVEGWWMIWEADRETLVTNR
jgi:hypothetical protein